jgi:hypothetical protein
MTVPKKFVSAYDPKFKGKRPPSLKAKKGEGPDLSISPREYTWIEYGGGFGSARTAGVLTEEDIMILHKKYLMPLGDPPPLDLDINPFMDMILDAEPVGSRVTCNPPPMDTDEDILILTSELYPLIKKLKEAGYKGGDVYFDTESGKATNNFYSLRVGNINLIITGEKQFFDEFMLATHVCKTLNVMEKKDRITVFQAILYHAAK